MRCCSSIGYGLLWFLWEENARLQFLFVRPEPRPVLEWWKDWAKQPVVNRIRQLGEKHEGTLRLNGSEYPIVGGTITIEDGTVMAIAPS